MFKRLQDLYKGRHFSFYSPYTIEEVLDRFASLSKPISEKTLDEITSYPVSIHFLAKDDGSYGFECEWDTGRGHKIFAVGELQSDDIGGVYVKSNVFFGSYTLLLLPIIVVIPLMLLGWITYFSKPTWNSFEILMLALIAIAIGMYILFLPNQLDQKHKLIYETLATFEHSPIL